MCMCMCMCMCSSGADLVARGADPNPNPTPTPTPNPTPKQALGVPAARVPRFPPKRSYATQDEPFAARRQEELNAYLGQVSKYTVVSSNT